MKTILFDFGNVVGFFDHRRAIAKLARHTDLTPDEIDEAVYHPERHTAYERGALTTAEFVKLALEHGRLRCSEAEFEAAFADIFWRNDPVCELIPRLKPNYRLLLASNTCDAHFRAFTREFADVLGHFDHLCASHDAGHRKPHPDFYVYCQKYAGAEPHECVFVDDLPRNVAAARAHGWDAILYRPGTDLVAEFDARGIRV
ncbi:MAG: HAD family phosphatase [Gemmataceae bacterium]